MLHYAGLDERVNAGIPAYEAALKAAGVDYTIYVYDGVNHAFNNDTSDARYDKDAADAGLVAHRGLPQGSPQLTSARPGGSRHWRLPFLCGLSGTISVAGLHRYPPRACRCICRLLAAPRKSSRPPSEMSGH